MAFQPVPGTSRLAVVYSRGGVLMVNIFHFYRDGQWGAQELGLLLDAFSGVWLTEVMPNLSNTVLVSRYEARGLRSQIDDYVALFPTTPHVGGRGGDLTPGNVAFCVTHTTGLAGRSARGRTYFGGFSEEDVSGDSISLQRAQNLRNALMSMRTATLGAGWVPVVVKRYENKALLPTAEVLPITGYRFTDTILDSQRRRLSNRGS